MTPDFANALAREVAGTPLAPRLERFAEPFLERRARELAALAPPPVALRRLARLLASNAESARWVSIRPELLRRLVELGPDTLRARAETLDAAAPPAAGEDLETFLDALRLFRRDETALAACVDLAGLARFEEVSQFLSRVAEVVLERALDRALAGVDDSAPLAFAVLAMGKLAGRELTHHSDLDLIFLYAGDTSQVSLASRVGQRLIHYLSTPTGAGTAYAIDARLRPSGRKGLLVTGYDAYERYQLEQARTWEHLALMRCRAVAGAVTRAAPVLREVQASVCARRLRPWSEIASLRARIAAERVRPNEAERALKAGPGGIMDVEFLAAGAQLERGHGPPGLPAVADMLASAASGPGADGVAASYRFLREVEARARWVVGRGLEALPGDAETLDAIAELCRPGLSGGALLRELGSVRATVRKAVERVLDGDSIDAL